MVFETRPGDPPFMNIFVEPVTVEYLEERAIEKQRRVDEFERAVIFPNEAPTTDSLQSAVDQPSSEVNEQVEKENEVDDGEKVDSSDSLMKLLQKQQEPAELDSSDSLAKLLLGQQEPAEPEPEPKGAIQRLVDLLSGQAADQAKETDTTAQLVQAQSSAVDIIREVSKLREADITDARRLTRKEELRKLKAATIKLDKWLDDIDSILVEGVQNTDHDDQIARLRDVTKRTLEDCQSLRLSHYDASSPILALALTVRNKVNGRYISGPPDVNRDDEWDIEYAIQEMEDHALAWSRYDACVARRDNASAFGKDDPEADEKWYQGRFMQELAEWSRRGALWRLEQDEIDRGLGRKEVFEPIDKSVVELDDDEGDEVVKEEEGKGVVEGYMTWLFSGKGGNGKKE